MKKLYILSILVVLTNSCATTESVSYDYDNTINFNHYTTFVLCVDDLFVENTNYPNYDNKYIREQLATTFENKMIALNHKTDVFNPQLQVGFKLVVKEEQITFTNCDNQNEYNYWDKCTINTEIYTNETLIAYVSDFEKNQIIWQATIPCDLNKSRNILLKYIPELTEKLFKTYPKSIK